MSSSPANLLAAVTLLPNHDQLNHSVIAPRATDSTRLDIAPSPFHRYRTIGGDDDGFPMNQFPCALRASSSQHDGLIPVFLSPSVEKTIFD